MAVQTLQPNTPHSLPHPTGHGVRFDVGGAAVSISTATNGRLAVSYTINPQHIADYEVTVEDGPVPKVKGRVKNAGFNMNVQITAAVPADCAIEAQVAGGALDVADRAGSLTCHVKGGSVRTGNVDGSLDGQVAGGSIAAGFVGGAVTAKVNGGSVHLGGVGGHADIDVLGGSMDVVFTGPPEGKLRASAGTIKMGVPGTAAFTLMARAQAGNVTIQPPLVPQPFTGSAFNGPINGGGATVEASASAGNVVVRAV
jgi:hypothetical protein